MARRMGGSLLVTTSARTPERATDALLGAVDVPFDLHRWAPDAPENPYFGYLGLADAVIVTCDSTSMLAEACATGKPVYMFDLAEDGDEIGERSLAARLRDGLEPDRVKAYLYRKLMWGLAPRKITRDIRVVHRHLLSTGRVAWLGDPAPAGPPLGDEVAHAAARVRDLVAPVAADEMRLTGS
jgi:hypothetical protein